MVASCSLVAIQNEHWRTTPRLKHGDDKQRPRTLHEDDHGRRPSSRPTADLEVTAKPAGWSRSSIPCPAAKANGETTGENKNLDHLDLVQEHHKLDLYISPHDCNVK
jgi:hypothetical protein